MFWCSGSGRIELEMSPEQARSAFHQGRCDDDVYCLSTEVAIREQLNTIDREILKGELKEYGAWDEQELADHEQNLQRLLWLAAGDLVDNPQIFE